jgi:hypothetical protein
MNTRIITKLDYDTILVKWWKDWRWTPPLYDSLPSTGIIVGKDDIDICAGFVYYTNSKMAWIEYIVSNFEYKEKDRKEIIEFTINVLCELAKDAGFKYLYTSLKNESLINRYSNCGFITGDANCQEMIKICQQ